MMRSFNQFREQTNNPVQKPKQVKPEQLFRSLLGKDFDVNRIVGKEDITI